MMRHPFRLLSSAFLICLLAVSGADARIAGERGLPIPATVSPEIQAGIAAGPPAWWSTHLASPEEWRRLRGSLAKGDADRMRKLCKRLGVKLVVGVRGGVRVHVLTPAKLPERNRNRVLLHLHGGGYALNPGISGAFEGILMARFGEITVISVDYRLAPEHPFPAALDDARAVYRDLVRNGVPAENIGVFGTSAGGSLTLSLMQTLMTEGLPLPAAISPGSPWADLRGTGDSRIVNEGVDVVVSGGWLASAARAYAGTADLDHPLLSPLNADVRGCPPALLISGTRDLLLSDTVRMHRKLLEAGVSAELIVHEGLSHAQYHFFPDAPETAFHFGRLARFFDGHLKN